MTDNKNDNEKEKLQHYNLFQSFSFAFQGIWYALKYERNLRIHLMVAAYFTYFALRYYDFSRAEIVLFILAVIFVIASELFNTSIEKTVDLKTPVYNPLAKIAKDVAAGAVLVASIGSFIIGVLLFWDLQIFAIILKDILKRFYIWIILIAVSLCIIFLPEKTYRTKNGNNKNEG